MENVNYLSKLLEDRNELFRLLTIAVVAAVGINLLTYGLTYYFNLGLYSIVVGAILGVISILLMVSLFFGVRDKELKIDGCITIMDKNREIVEIPRYRYMESVARYLKGAFAENPALEIQWNSAKNRKDITEMFEEGKFTLNETWHSLVRQVTEYFLLDRLSTHLTDYYNDDKIDKSRIVTYDRKDIPDILLENVFLELFSKPMELRPLFAGKEFYKKENVVASTGNKGAIFDRFELRLPRGVEVIKDNGNIVIKSNNFSITFRIDFWGFGAVLPLYFEKYYMNLNLKNHWDMHTYSVNTHVKIHFGFGMLLSKTGVQYFQWIDGFLNKLIEEFSIESFLNRIGWEHSLTTIEYLEKNKSDNTKTLNVFKP